LSDTQPVFVVSEKANRALDLLADHLKENLGKIVRTPAGALCPLSAREAQRIYFEAVRRVMSEGAFQESHDGRMVLVKCSKCGRTDTLAAKITRYRCKCDPHVDRFVFQDTLTSTDEETRLLRTPIETTKSPDDEATP
jgi:hypothetical protein